MADPSTVVSLNPEADEDTPQEVSASSEQTTQTEDKQRGELDFRKSLSAFLQNAAQRGSWGEYATFSSICVLTLAVIGLSLLLMSAPWTRDAHIDDRIEMRVADAGAAFQEKIDEATRELTGRIENASAETTALFGRLDAVVAGVDANVENLNRLQADFLAFEDRSASGLAGMRDDLAAIRAEVSIASSATSARIETLEQRWRAINTPPRNTTTIAPSRPSSVIPMQALPFRPLSLDQWGGVAQLAVKRGRETRFLSEGDRLDGWRVTAVVHDSAQLTAPNGGAIRLLFRDGRIETAPPDMATLTVKATPSDARIRVMNIKPAYFAGMPLAPGAYDIEVTREGYAPMRRWIRLGDADRTLSVSLVRLN